MGDPTRLAIVERLGLGPRPVGELAAAFPVTRSAVSQHLKVLQDAGVVRHERVGNRNVYRLDPTGRSPSSPTGSPPGGPRATTSGRRPWRRS